MPTLRVTHVPEAGRVELTLDGLSVSHSATVDVQFAMTVRDQQDLRWYLEEYLAPAAAATGHLPIRNAAAIQPDVRLRGSRVKITLDRLRVAGYPGSGTHNVLFDFHAQNQVPGDVEHLHFNATLRARAGEAAAIVGYPIFLGLNVGQEGVAFKCFTVNVKNDDERFLNFPDSDTCRAGLRLATTVQPAIAPLSGMALGVTNTIAARHRNVAVQDFYMGLDFSDVPIRARLAEGAYIAVHIPETVRSVWNWDEWVYSVSSGQIVRSSDATTLIPFNYVVFSVSRYLDA